MWFDTDLWQFFGQVSRITTAKTCLHCALSLALSKFLTVGIIVSQIQLKMNLFEGQKHPLEVGVWVRIEYLRNGWLILILLVVPRNNTYGITSYHVIIYDYLCLSSMQLQKLRQLKR
jgi:hypothetical protein